MSDEHPMSGACYRCTHRRDVTGSAHSACHHPSTRELQAVPAMQFAGLMGRRGGSLMAAEVRLLAAPAARRLNVEGHQRGIDGGWFIWPVNFDPVWLESCDGFTAKDAAIAENLATYGGGAD